MKRIAALLLTSLLLFNWYGYRLVSAYFEGLADQQIESAITLHHYNDEDLLRLTVPLNLPYQNTDQDFKRVEGKIDIDGKSYNYVKRRIINDSMVLLCLPNAEKTKLTNAKHIYFAETSGADQSEKGKTKHSSLNLKFLGLDAELTPFCLSDCAASGVVSANPWNIEYLIDTKVDRLPAEPPESLQIS